METLADFKVFISRKIPQAGLDRILEVCRPEIWSEPTPPPREILLEKVTHCDGLLTMLSDQVDAELMEAAGKQLKVVSNFAVGYNNIDIPEATKRGIAIGNTPDVLTDATADMAFALLVAAARRLPESVDYIREGRWKNWDALGHIGQDLTGKTIGIVGMGRIGYAMAKRCHLGWDMPVIYHSNHHNHQADQDLQARKVDFEQLLRESDFISVHVSLNDQTRGMFDRSAFGKMKETAIFVNTARGPIHQQHDLHHALTEGEIFAAGIDVTDPEPMPQTDPLLNLANCVITPHIASATLKTRNSMAEISADNLLSGLQQLPLRCPVNPEVNRPE